MFTSFDEENFWQAIKDKNYLRLKVNTVSTMLNDPTFERGETDKVLEILSKKVPEIFEDEVRLEYEERLNRSQWDKTYFSNLTRWFKENFAKSRLDYIREVGRVVHADTARQYKKSMEIASNSGSTSGRQSDKNTSYSRSPKNPTRAPETKDMKSLLKAIAAIGALVLVIIWIVKMLLN